MYSFPPPPPPPSHSFFIGPTVINIHVVQKLTQREPRAWALPYSPGPVWGQPCPWACDRRYSRILQYLELLGFGLLTLKGAEALVTR